MKKISNILQSKYRKKQAKIDLCLRSIWVHTYVYKVVGHILKFCNYAKVSLKVLWLLIKWLKQ